jgi:hypothetical protein
VFDTSVTSTAVLAKVDTTTGTLVNDGSHDALRRQASAIATDAQIRALLIEWQT